MAEEKIHKVDVVLRYYVTGSKSAAEESLSEAYRHGEGFPNRISNTNYEARFVCSDVNPGQVEGYCNYETSSIALWLNNDRDLYDQCRAVARTAISPEEAAARTEREDVRSPELVMADFLEEFVERKLEVDRREEKARTDAERMFVSMAQAALERVNWLELGEEWIQDAQEG